MGRKGRRKCVLVCLLALTVLAWGMVEKASQPEAVAVTQLVSWGTRGDLGETDSGETPPAGVLSRYTRWYLWHQNI